MMVLNFKIPVLTLSRSIVLPSDSTITLKFQESYGLQKIKLSTDQVDREVDITEIFQIKLI